MPLFRVGNIVRDQRVLMAARQEVEQLIAARSPELDRLIHHIRRRPQYGLASIG